MTFFLTFHDPLHNGPRLSQLLGCQPFFWDFLDTCFFCRPFTTVFYTRLLHLSGRRNTVLMSAGGATFADRRGADCRSIPVISQSPLERARIYSKRSLIFQRKPSVGLWAERYRPSLSNCAPDGSLITFSEIGFSSIGSPLELSYP